MTIPKSLVVAVMICMAGCSPDPRQASPGPSSPSPTSLAQAADQAPELPQPTATSGAYRPTDETGMIRIDDKGWMLSAAKWKDLSIPVCWEVPKKDLGADHEIVRNAVVASWQTHSAVKFSERWEACGSNPQGIRIRVSDEGPHTKGLGTQIAKVPAGMVLNFSFKNWSPACQTQREMCIKSIAVHEFGHALGFAHEQNRIDTPASCTKPPQGGPGDTILTPWDKDSVMNYCNAVYNNNGVLSEGDIKSVKRIYGAPS